MKRDKHHVSQHPKFVRGRLKAIVHFIDTLPDTEDKHSPRELLKMGFVHPEIEYNVSAKTAQFGVSQSEAPLTFTELANYSTWFYIHPEKIAGTETVVTSRDFPIKISGTRKEVENTILQSLNTTPRQQSPNPPPTDKEMKKQLRREQALKLAEEFEKNLKSRGLGSLQGQHLPPLDTATYTLLKSIPSGSLSGLSGLGRISPKKGTKPQVLSFEEVDALYNAGITLEEKQAWVYYQKNKGEKMTGWDKYDTGKPSPQKLKELVEKGALFYLNGALLPYPIYTYANIYDRLLDLEKDSKAIVKNYGKEAYELHVKALEEVKPKQISVRAPDSSDRPVILAISGFATDTDSFKVHALDEALVDIELPTEAASEGVSLQTAFSAWMRRLPESDFENVTPYEIQHFYLEAKRFTKENTEEARELIEQYAPKEGEALFSRFLYEALSDEDKVKLDFTWNRQYNGQSSVQYQRIPVGFTCSALFKTAPLSITPIQREGIAFMTAVGSGIIAYDVGVGKTMTAIINIANALYSGKCKRPLIVVPNPTYNKWVKELFGYTDTATGQFIAGVLSGTGYTVNAWYNLNAQSVNPAVLKKKVAENSITVLTYEGFMRLGFSQKLMDGLFDELSHILMQSDEGKKTKRDTAKLTLSLEELVGGSNKQTVVNVDDLGFDFVCVDEAHNYKNVFAYVPPDEKGSKRFKIDGGLSARAQKMFFINNYIQRTYGANVMMLTATPFTNNPLEIYSMLAMVGYDNMKKYGVTNLYDFMETFIHQSFEFTMTYQGDIEKKHVVKSFNNRLVLQRLIYNHISYKTGEEAGVKRPCKINLPRTTKTDPKTGLAVKLPPDEQLVTYLQMTEEQYINQANINAYPDNFTRFEKIKAIMRCLGWSLDNALSPFLYTKTYPATPQDFIDSSPKIKYTVECIRSVKEWHEKRGEPVSGQVIYLNRGKDYFQYIVDYLIDNVGFKRSVTYKKATLCEVEVLTSEVSQTRRELIKDAFLEGIVKVVIGTASIREGIDLQRKGTVLYNCYPDWNPTDAKQLEGRIWRQGNEYGYVRVVMPLVQDSMDVFVFQKLEEKTHRINDIWYRSDRGNVLDVDSLDTEEVKFALYTNIDELVKIVRERELTDVHKKIQVIKSQIQTVDNIETDRAGLIQFRAECQKYPDMWLNALTDLVRNPSDYTYSFQTTREGMLKVAEKATELIKEIQTYKTSLPQEDKALIALQRKIAASVFTLRRITDRGYTEFARYKAYTGAIAKAQRTVFEAKGYSMDTDFEAVKNQLVTEQNQAEEVYAGILSKENTERITQEILLKKEKLKISGRVATHAAEDFKSLNHLLAYSFNQVDNGSCIIPSPGTEPKADPDRERRKRRALAEAAALELEFIFLKLA